MSSLAFVMLSQAAWAQLPPEAVLNQQPAAAAGPAAIGDAIGGTVGNLAGKAADLKNRMLPNGLAGVLPSGLPLPPELLGGPALPGPGQVSPEFSQGQDKSVTVTSEGRPESLFFTPNQLASIMRGREGFLAPREAFDPANQGDNPATAAQQTLTLTGIVYVSKKDWVIWFNGERVTHDNMPQRLVGLTVMPDRVKIRWMDVPRQRIINITLEPHQQYLLDSDTIIPLS